VTERFPEALRIEAQSIPEAQNIIPAGKEFLSPANKAGEIEKNINCTKYI